MPRQACASIPRTPSSAITNTFPQALLSSQRDRMGSKLVHGSLPTTDFGLIPTLDTCSQIITATTKEATYLGETETSPGIMTEQKFVTPMISTVPAKFIIQQTSKTEAQRALQLFQHDVSDLGMDRKVWHKMLPL